MTIIAHNRDDPQGVYPIITWSNLTESDTADEAEWPGGEGFMEVTGDFGGATLTMDFGLTSGSLYNPDTETAPDGTVFTEDGILKFDLPRGYVLPVATGGSSQSVKVVIIPARQEK